MLWSGYYEHVDLSDNSNKSQVQKQLKENINFQTGKLGEENSEDNYAKYADNICENISAKKFVRLFLVLSA